MTHSRNYKYLWSLLPAVFVVTGNLMGGWWVALNTIFSLGVLAIFENFVPDDKSNETDENDWFPDGILLMHVLVQMICIGSLIYSMSTYNYNLIQFLIMCLSTGVNSGSSAIVIAHELVHRKNKFMRMMGQLLLFTTCNIYFYIDHLKIHHKWVGTDRDPATARYGENLYKFFVRSTFGQIKSSYLVEAARLKADGRLPWSPNNYVVGSVIWQVILWFVLMVLFGQMVLLAFIMQGFFANFLLEYTNYIEHYGLARNEKDRVTEVHSWQTDKVISRFFLIDLSRHADHHYYSSKPYHTLKSYEKSPVLPGGYVSMIYYAIIPPLFFKKIHAMMKEYQLQGII